MALNGGKGWWRNFWKRIYNEVMLDGLVPPLGVEPRAYWGAFLSLDLSRYLAFRPIRSYFQQPQETEWPMFSEPVSINFTVPQSHRQSQSPLLVWISTPANERTTRRPYLLLVRSCLNLPGRMEPPKGVEPLLSGSRSGVPRLNEGGWLSAGAMIIYTSLEWLG